ncbi:MAG: leucine-rich repeat domain-containing protein [Clostridia bacterium]|nr:leucine-rich repeat domain-containing protein [Clostridia bacterium]MDD4375604.1 leucine-rich repeat domain-containing protein [Clostridia bacterium]
MIVLAGAIILSLNSSNIIGRAGEAKTKVDMATVKEQIGIVKAEALLNDSTGDFSKINKGDLPIEISSKGEVSLTGNVDDKTVETFMDVFVETAPESDFDYSENNGKITITGYKRKADNIKYLKIPSTINGKPVIGIGSSVFYACFSLTNVVIPNSVISIGTEAFYNCSGLTNITIPNSVTSIGIFSFFNCSSLTNIIIPNSMTSIGLYAFSTCTSLTNIIIPNSVNSIASNAFYNCTSLTSIKIKRPNDGTLTGAPWSAPNATVTWNYTGK